MSRYIIETRNYTSILRGFIRKAVEREPVLLKRMRFDASKIPHGILNETVIRLFWNDLNHLAKYPYETWDDEGIIGEWFEGYSMEETKLSRSDDSFRADELSELLHDLVIDPIIDHIHCNIYDRNLRSDWSWEEFKIEEIRNHCFILKNLGDFRIRDWERLKEEYEPTHRGNQRDPHYFHTTGIS